MKVFGRNGFFDQVFHLGDIVIGQFNARPVGAFMLMVNCPASVCGKKASPRNG